MSEGQDEPVEFFYGADARLDVLHQRLRTIYPPSFDIDRLEVDLVKKLLQSVEYRSAEFRERLTDGRLYDPDSIDQLPTEDGQAHIDARTIRARPSLDEVTPYGVRWRGSVDRRKDWMTTLSGFSELLSSRASPAEEGTPNSGRAPLAPLVDQLTKAAQPLAFQVVFQRKADWSRHARRRSGALLAGKDILLHKLLSLESPAPTCIQLRCPRQPVSPPPPTQLQ